ncbi:ATP-dependent DNA helicase PIF1 [Corchorus capsularis]|uniref:ATP-dependent DNA helicase PIF1 n=1 Tax=Corchorus capsularis TaxID=210143 RepID=A0A1R3J226_COCAP|nr:ATP-dependent DNA helicase PIF1 [Corchorus capsularis]
MDLASCHPVLSEELPSGGQTIPLDVFLHDVPVSIYFVTSTPSPSVRPWKRPCPPGASSPIQVAYVGDSSSSAPSLDGLVSFSFFDTPIIDVPVHEPFDVVPEPGVSFVVCHGSEDELIDVPVVLVRSTPDPSLTLPDSDHLVHRGYTVDMTTTVEHCPLVDSGLMVDQSSSSVEWAGVGPLSATCKCCANSRPYRLDKRRRTFEDMGSSQLVTVGAGDRVLGDVSVPMSSSHHAGSSSSGGPPDIGGEIDNFVNVGSGPYVFKLHHQTYHEIGPLLPVDGHRPWFAQLYIYNCTNEVSNRVYSVAGADATDNVNRVIVEGLMNMLDSCNEVVKLFCTARVRIDSKPTKVVRIRLIRSMGAQPWTYSVPTSTQIGGLIFGDFGQFNGDRDVIVEHKDGRFNSIRDPRGNGTQVCM